MAVWQYMLLFPRELLSYLLWRCLLQERCGGNGAADGDGGDHEQLSAQKVTESKQFLALTRLNEAYYRKEYTVSFRDTPAAARNDLFFLTWSTRNPSGFSPPRTTRPRCLGKDFSPSAPLGGAVAQQSRPGGSPPAAERPERAGPSRVFCTPYLSELSLREIYVQWAGFISKFQEKPA